MRLAPLLLRVALIVALALPAVRSAGAWERYDMDRLHMVVLPPPPIEWDWREKDHARMEAVRAVAEKLMAEYRAWIVQDPSPSSPMFFCAMTEKQARALAADPRVKLVAESTYMLLD